MEAQLPDFYSSSFQQVEKKKTEKNREPSLFCTWRVLPFFLPTKLPSDSESPPERLDVSTRKGE